MENQEETLLYKIMQQMDGMETNKVQELLYRTIMMLHVTKSPINIQKIEKIWFPEIHATKTTNATGYLFTAEGHEYFGRGGNSQIQLYQRVDLWYSKLFTKQCLYYRLPNNPSRTLQKLTKINLLNDFSATPFESKLCEFLTRHSVFEVNNDTGNFNILEVLNSLELSGSGYNN